MDGRSGVYNSGTAGGARCFNEAAITGDRKDRPKIRPWMAILVCTTPRTEVPGRFKETAIMDDRTN
jgi:hypothetical protein